MKLTVARLSSAYHLGSYLTGDVVELASCFIKRHLLSIQHLLNALDVGHYILSLFERLMAVCTLSSPDDTYSLVDVHSCSFDGVAQGTDSSCCFDEPLVQRRVDEVRHRYGMGWAEGKERAR